MATFGVNMDEGLKQRIEEPLEYGESRSDRIRLLIQFGLAAEAEMRRHGVDTDDPEQARHFIQSAISGYVDDNRE